MSPVAGLAILKLAGISARQRPLHVVVVGSYIIFVFVGDGV